MIVYGAKSTELTSEKADRIECPHCDERGWTSHRMRSRYVHIFWIPFIPYGKKGEAFCENCDCITKPKDMPEQMLRAYNFYKAEKHIPIWHFSGLALLACFILYFYYHNAAIEKRELDYLANPHLGDVYEYSLLTGDHSTMRIAYFNDDSVWVHYNQYVTDKKRDVYKIYDSSNYEKYAFGISRDSIAFLYQSNTIYRIKREKP